MTSGPAARRPAPGGLARWRHWISCGLLIGSLAFIALFFVRNQDELRLLLNIGALDLGLLLLLNLLYLTLHGCLYRMVLEKCGGLAVGFRPWFRIYIMGRFLNHVIPQLGNVYRGLRLKQLFGISYTRYISGFFSVAWLGTCFNLIIAGAIIAVLDPTLRFGPLPALGCVFGLAALLIGGPLLADALISRASTGPASLMWIQEKLSEVLRTSVRSLRDIRYSLGLLLWSLALLTQVCLIYHLTFDALGLSVSLPQIALFFVLIQLSTYVNLTPGNLGIQEIAFGLLGTQLGLGLAEGLLAAAMLRVFGTLSLLTVAVPMGGLQLSRRSSELLRQNES